MVLLLALHETKKELEKYSCPVGPFGAFLFGWIGYSKILSHAAE
jgi:hypothetical protein